MRNFKTTAVISVVVAILFVVAACTPSDTNGVKVTTYSPQDITSKSAMCGGEVVVQGDIALNELGVCWGTSKNPTADGTHLSTSNWQQPFTCKINHLTPGTTYHVRAYVKRGLECYYGNDVTFTTTMGGGGGANVAGTIQGKFSVAMGEQVYFSQGNLQYHPVQQQWRFAEKQWDIIGAENANVSANYNGWIDLMGWGTSGFNNKYPYMTETMSQAYAEEFADISGTNYDWGVYNPISNGGNQAGIWRVLERNEWEYVFFKRQTSSGIRYAKATVNGIYGVILLPDDWNTSYYSLNNVNSNTNSAVYSGNEVSATDWTSKFENHGAVFLPAGGTRVGISTTTYSHGLATDASGWYWSGTMCDGNRAYILYFSNASLLPYREYYIGPAMSVRLVRDVE